MSRLRARVLRLESAILPGELSDVDRAHIAAWVAHTAHKLAGRPEPTGQQVELRRRPGFWTRLQAAVGRPAFAQACIAAMATKRNSQSHQEHSPCPS